MSDNKRTIKTTRNRSVVLDPALVRERSRRLGILNFKQFQNRYCEFSENFNPNASTNTPENAWYGRKLDKNRAIKVADMLSLNGDYTELQQRQGNSWTELLDKAEAEIDVKLIVEKRDCLDFIEFDWEEQEQLPQYKNGSAFYIQVRTSLAMPNMLAFVYAQGQYMQISPVSHPKFGLFKDGSGFKYPAHCTLRFDRKEQPGYRKLITIIGEDLPVSPISIHDSKYKSQSELETIAERILMREKPYSVSAIAFELI